MATVHREPNQVKWIGVRPGHNGEQVFGYASCLNVLTEVYAVPVDKLLLLYDYAINLFGTVAGGGSLAVWTAVPALAYNLWDGTSGVSIGLNVNHRFDPPAEIPAGYTIEAITSAGTMRIRAVIHGILIDV